MQYTTGEHIDLSGYAERFENRKDDGVDFEFQEVGKEMQSFFKANIWHLFYKYKLDDIKYAFEQCKKYKKPYVGYLLAVIKKRA